MRTRYALVVLSFGGALLGPAGLMLYLLFPDWSLMYLANPAHLALGVMAPLIFSTHALAPFAGFLVMHRLLVTERARYVVHFALVLVALAVVGLGRLSTVQSYAGYHAGGERLAVLDSPLSLALVVVALAWGGLLAFAILAVRRHVLLSELLPMRLTPDPERGSGPGSSVDVGTS